MDLSKFDVGVQTFPGDILSDDSVICTCTSCKNRMQLEWQFKPTNIDKLKNQVPKVSLGTAEFPNIILDS